MIRLLLAVSILALLACENTTGTSGGDSDTLYIVSTYPAAYYQSKGGDTAGALVHTVQQHNLDSTNGFKLTKITERVYGEGWKITVMPKVDGHTQNYGTLDILTAPSNKAYYYELATSEWVKVSLDAVYDSMEIKGVW